MCEETGGWAMEQGLQGFSVKNTDPRKALILEREEGKRKREKPSRRMCGKGNKKGKFSIQNNNWGANKITTVTER